MVAFSRRRAGEDRLVLLTNGELVPVPCRRWCMIRRNGRLEPLVAAICVARLGETVQGLASGAVGEVVR